MVNCSCTPTDGDNDNDKKKQEGIFFGIYFFYVYIHCLDHCTHRRALKKTQPEYKIN